jgi:hypothetical protein
VTVSSLTDGTSPHPSARASGRMDRRVIGSPAGMRPSAPAPSKPRRHPGRGGLPQFHDSSHGGGRHRFTRLGAARQRHAYRQSASQGRTGTLGEGTQEEALDARAGRGVSNHWSATDFVARSGLRVAAANTAPALEALGLVVLHDTAHRESVWVVRWAGRRPLMLARLTACGQGRLTGPHPAGQQSERTTVMHNPRGGLTDAERARRRKQDRQRLHEAAQQLLSSDGWQRWIRVRARGGLARLSFNNQLLVALSCPEATLVAGFKAWLRSGSSIRAWRARSRSPDRKSARPAGGPGRRAPGGFRTASRCCV